MNGKTVGIGNSNSAAIDTGTTLIGAPTAAVNGIWGAVKGAVPLSGQMAGFFSFRTCFYCTPFSRGAGMRQGSQEVLHIDIFGPII